MSHIIAHIILKRKVTFSILAIILIGGLYYGYQRAQNSQGEVRYIFALVEKGTVISSVSGSGQVSVSNQVELKPKVSGDVMAVLAKSGQAVKAGTVLVQLDARDAQKTVRDAQANLEAAQLALEKLKKPADALALLQAEHAVTQAQEGKQTAQSDLAKAYEDGFNTVANAFLDLPAIMSGLQTMFFDSTIEQTQANLDWYANQVNRWENLKAGRYRDDLVAAYNLARQRYVINFDHYKVSSRVAPVASQEALITETYETAKLIAETVKTGNNYVDFIQDVLEQRDVTVAPIITTHQAALDTYTGKTNTQLANLLAITRAIADAKTRILNGERAVAEKTEALSKLKVGAEALDIQAQELTVRQRRNALLDAQEKLADYSLRAPFNGIAAKLDLKPGDAVTPSTVVTPFITTQQLAEVSLNEVDVAKVKPGQKATLIFDAISDLKITGQIAEVDTIGTMAQGVVTYTVKITFDTQDERVKPGMSVSSEIVLATKENVLIVPNSALKSQGERQYVEMGSGEGSGESRALRRQTVETGLASDTFTESVSGLNEGDRIVVRTINSVSNNAVPRAPSLFGAPGGSRGQGGNLRFPR